MNPMKSARLCVPVMLMALGAPQPLLADSYPRQPGVDLRDYAFDVTLGDASNEISVRESIDLAFTADGVRTLDLDLCNVIAAPPADPREPCQVPRRRGQSADEAAATAASNIGRGMVVTEVASGHTPLTFRHAGNKLSITFARPSRKGERTTISLAYRGVPAAGLLIGKNRYGDRVFFSDNWPNRGRNWLATIDHVSVKATKAISVTAPAHYQIVSNGRLTSSIDRPGDLRQTTWREAVPVPSWQFALGAAPLAVHNVDQRGDVAFSVWLAPQNTTTDFKVLAARNASAFDFYSERIGPYPFEKLAHVEASGGIGAYELASSIFYNGDFDAMTHEMAHQWFGNSVTEADWNDIWLSEGFATYFALLHTEHTEGRDAFLKSLRRMREGAVKYALAHPADTIVHKNLAHDSDVLANGAQIYLGGAMALHTLRGVVGDERFWAGVQLYYKRHRDGSATTDDFRRAIEDACREGGDCPAEASDLSWFFDQWLRRGGLPRVSGDWHYDLAAKALQITLTQEQTQGWYRIPATIAVTLSPGPPPASGPPAPTEKLSKIVLDGRRTTLTIPLDGPPADVRLDPDTWVPLMQADFRGR